MQILPRAPYSSRCGIARGLAVPTAAAIFIGVVLNLSLVLGEANSREILRKRCEQLQPPPRIFAACEFYASQYSCHRCCSRFKCTAGMSTYAKSSQRGPYRDCSVRCGTSMRGSQS